MSAQAVNIVPRRESRLSQHAMQRSYQRWIPAHIIDALLDFGERASASGGAETCYFTKRAWRRFATYIGTEARHFERYRSACAVIGGDGHGITACWRH